MKTDQWSGMWWRETCRKGGWFLLVAWLMTPAAFGKNNWFSGRTVNGQTWPIAAGPAAAEVERIQNISKAYVTNGLIDIVISLYNNPRGDDDGQTQGNPGSVEQDNYEYIIQYFADAMYEATEGCHGLRNVRIYRNGQQQNADVIWAAAGHPCARPLNINGRNAYIHMYDVFVKDNTNIVAVYTNSAEHEIGGYCLGHEWGHYAYGIFDEYCRWGGSDWTKLPYIEKVRPSIMNYQGNARNRHYSWLNYSIRWQGGSNNIVGTNVVSTFLPYENRLRGAQHQLLENSCWGSLRLSPINDPTRTAYQRALRRDFGQRLSYPELASVAPAGNNPPQITLSSTDPLNTLPSRRSLNIIWMGGSNGVNQGATELAIELVIDRSGSMGYNSKISRAKTVAKILLDQISNGSAVGVVDFDTTATVLYPVTVITNVAIRNSIKTAINTLTPREYSAMGDAAQLALSELTAFGHTNMTKAVFLLSDGYSNEGSDPLDVCMDYANAQVPIMGFCFGTEFDNTIPLMSWATGGESFSALTNLQIVVNAFREAYAVAAGRHLLAQGNAAGAQGFKASGAFNISFTVDASLGDLSVAVGHSLSNTVVVTLNSPDGTVYHASSTNDDDSERALLFLVTAPTAGVWNITGSATPDNDVWYQVEAGASAFTYNLTASAAGQNFVSFPAPLEIVACLNKTRDINGAIVTAEITVTNDSATVSLVLSNSSPGQYTAFYPANNGFYTVVVRADNSAGTAYLTSAGELPSATDEGDLVQRTPDEPITEAFARTVTFQVTVTNVPEDLTVPATPTGVSASDGVYANEVEVGWNAVTNAQVYEIWRHTSDQSDAAVKLDEVNYMFTNYFDASASNSVIYYYWVKAKNIIGSSAFSAADAGRRQLISAVVCADYDGDGKADPALYVESTGDWYVKLSASGYGLVTINFGGPGYTACVGDYDGDGKADPTVYQAPTGNWYVELSGSGYAIASLAGFGGSAYQAVAGDYDGDGKADPAIYGTASGDWQVAMSGLGYGIASATGFGGTNYTAVQENYDADNRADAAVYNIANGNWTVLLSASSYITGTLWGFGGAGYEPVIGDYDGDRLADPAIYLESMGSWQVKLSGSGYAEASLVGFGGSEYRAAAYDFDGDRKADPALFEIATGMWYVKLSAGGYATASTPSGYTP
ncbi:MAG: VWA domain-containing protein [Verrucomicrobia bacterium]|nr:VWA domain-containing protein [Verrucomicrobiota bacterium]MBU4248445.1 VWA domain-containing protein [Verrucomicrobiota bacterium]MBU4292347.1 VWA domain-containing protein [Verrucomicrobiota bacterium]MBU4498431.1 VWA domain-containing protein [Verrucomicrobiota bacterium]MCG2681969.1 VWA domain-containing protein [Kiritimatiellia bacterium]